LHQQADDDFQDTPRCVEPHREALKTTFKLETFLEATFQSPMVLIAQDFVYQMFDIAFQPGRYEVKKVWNLLEEE